jgi:hypothetical protein
MVVWSIIIFTKYDRLRIKNSTSGNIKTIKLRLNIKKVTILLTLYILVDELLN